MEGPINDVVATGCAFPLIYHPGTSYMERDNLMHGARTALNSIPEMREWAENYLKEKTRTDNLSMSDEEFEKYWKYHKPEIMHAGAAEAAQAYKQRSRD